MKTIDLAQRLSDLHEAEAEVQVLAEDLLRKIQEVRSFHARLRVECVRSIRADGGAEGTFMSLLEAFRVDPANQALRVVVADALETHGFLTYAEGVRSGAGGVDVVPSSVKLLTKLRRLREAEKVTERIPDLALPYDVLDRCMHE